MKLKKLKNPKYFSLKLQILKLSYKKKQFKQDASLKSTEILLNKIANIIFQYSTANKKILFIGFPNNFNKTLENTKHIAIPEFMLLNGLLHNNNTVLNNPNNEIKISKNIFKLTLKLKRKADLIMAYNLTNEMIAIKESYLATIPLITINSKWDILNNKAAYESTGNYYFHFEKNENRQFMFSLISTLITTSKRYKKSRSNVWTKNPFTPTTLLNKKT
jgi:hypothetical protein